MKTITLGCPSCNAILKTEDGIDTFYCIHCGHKIFLDGLSEASINAKVRIKEMKHKEVIKDKEISHEQYKIEQEEKENKRNMIPAIVFFGVVIVGFIIMCCLAYSNHKAQEVQLQSIVVEIEKDIKNEDYDSAIIKANSLYYTADWSSDVEKKWDETRKAIIKRIEKAQKKGWFW